ncbi:MAG TPA: universal stress protein [Gaiellaceae bacterium]|nr:universal stress protein [Gaiellaceae bacterium]
MKRILVAYEERPVSPRVLERAAELARVFHAKVIATSVAPVLQVARGVGPYDPADPPSRHEQELLDARARLAELGVADVEIVTAVGDPAHAILDLAAEKEVDLIVIGAHEGGALSRLLGASPTDEVVHRAPVDVLVVH